jgi:hypothetical protein
MISIPSLLKTGLLPAAFIQAVISLLKLFDIGREQSRE